MTIDKKIRDEKLQHDINKKAAKISKLPACKIDIYEYLRDEGILPSDHSQIIEQTEFTYNPLWKAFEKQTKTIEDQGDKQTNALESLKNEYQDEDEVEIENIDYDEVRKRLGLDEYKILPLKGKMELDLNLRGQANNLASLRNQVIKCEYK